MSESRPEAARLCPRCGATPPPGRYCTNCGARVEAVSDGVRSQAAPPPAVPSTSRPQLQLTARAEHSSPAPERPHHSGLRRRTGLVLGVLVLALLAVAGVGARMLWAQIPADDASQVTCWDGSQAAADDCAVPSGRDGLRWVFPSFRPNQGDCRDVREEFADLERPTMWQCEEQVAGRPVVVTYSELDSVEQGVDFFEEEYAGGRRREVADGGTVYRYDYLQDPGPGRTHLAASTYADYPFAVVVRARTPEDARQALREVVLFRPPQEVVTRPTGRGTSALTAVSTTAVSTTAVSTTAVSTTAR